MVRRVLAEREWDAFCLTVYLCTQRVQQWDLSGQQQYTMPWTACKAGNHSSPVSV